MSKEEILENNDIIAKFMGGKYETNLPFEYIKTGWTNTPANDNQQIAQSHQFKYNFSWNWLMPVVEKIESFKHPVYICGNNCQIYEKKSWGKDIGWFTDSYGRDKLEAVYLAIIDFINWYNQNKFNETN